MSRMMKLLCALTVVSMAGMTGRSDCPPPVCYEIECVTVGGLVSCVNARRHNLIEWLPCGEACSNQNCDTRECTCP